MLMHLLVFSNFAPNEMLSGNFIFTLADRKCFVMLDQGI